MRKNLLFLVIISLFSTAGFAQELSNKGKDFWVGYGNHIRMLQATTPEQMQIYLTSDVSTTGSVSFSSGTPSIPFTVTANQITVIDVPQRTTNYLPDEGLYTRGIHITALKDIVAYGFIYVNAVSGATVFLPTNTLGKEYYSVNYTQVSNETAQSYSYFFVEAVETGTTTVEITPTKLTKNGWPAGVTQTINLTQGQIYQVLATSDLTGSKVKSIASGTSGCKRVAFFCGSGKISIGCGSPGSSDNLYQQMYPASTWGKKYVLIPSNSVPGNINTPVTTLPVINTNFFRIYRPDATSIVTLNGVVIPAGNFVNNSYDFSSNQTNVVEADKSILVAQYFSTASCSGNNNPHDPEMIYLNPVEQTIDDVTVNSMQPASNTAIYQHHINVVLKNAGTGVSSFQIDGITPPASAFTVLPQDNSFSYIRIRKQGGSTTASAPNLTLGAHRLTCDSGFNAIAYGFGAAESYGYSAGASLRDFNQQLFTTSQYGILNDGISYACLNTPFNFSVYLPETAVSNSGASAGTVVPIRYDSMLWSVTSATNFVPNNFPVMVTPANQAAASGIPASNFLPYYPNFVLRPDSIRIRNGKSVAFYSLPTAYAITAPGTYTITVRGYRTNINGDGCTSGNETDFEFTLVVPNAPLASFIKTQPGCPADSVYFTETNIQTPAASSTYLFTWNFGDPASGAANTSTLRNPVHRFSGPGTYTVTFSNITAAGCVSATTSQQVIVPNLVNATIAGTTAVCQNATPPNISFTITPGLAPYKIKYTLSTNGGAPVAQPDIITSALINTIPAPTAVPGTFVYSFTSVENANAAYCTVPIAQTATVTVNPLPTATITGTINVCQNSTAPTITFTGANATAPYTFTYNINGGANQTITTTTGNSVTLAAPTTTVGTYNYNLVSVIDASSTLCTNPAIGIATVVVQAKPNATITGTVSLCQDAAAPNITFNGINGNAPFTFTYNINGGATQTVSTLATSNIVTVPVSMAATGTFVYNLLSVQNTGPTTCITNITGASATVVINPVPTATISGTTSVCQVAGSQTVTFTGAGGTAPYTFIYSINGVTQTAVISIGNVATVNAPVTTVGTFVYKIISVRDASSTLCLNTFAIALQPTATVIVQATSTATISGSTTVCQDATAPTITFSAANGVAPFTFGYTVTTNGVTGALQTIQSIPSTSFSTTLTVPMTTVGTLVYTLVSVKNTGTLNCTTPITGQTATVIINPIPTATITGTTTVCQNTGTQPITFTGFGGTGASYVFNYTINGVVQPALTGNNMVINQASTAFGIYTYVITSVKDNATGCTKTYTTNAPTSIVTVKQLATATIVTSAATVCQNSAAPFITFTATGGVAPFTFTYKINGGANLTVTTVIGSSVTVPVPTTTHGTYIHTLVSVQESSSVACVNAQTGSTQVIVHPQPTASFTTAAPYCAQKAVTFSPAFGIMPTGSVVSWVWDYGDGTGTQIRPDGNPFTITYATAGIKPVSFKVVSDKGCESILATTPAVVINSKPKAGFKSPEACLADAFAQFYDTSTVVGGSIVNWEWDFGDGTPIYTGSTPAHQNPLHAYLTVGIKTVRLIVTSNSGCKDTVPSQSFFINGEVTSANFIPQNSGNFCSNRPVQIKENSVVNVGGLIRVDIYWDNLTTPTIFELDDFPTPNKIYTHSYPNLQIDKTYQIRYIAYSGFNGLCQKEIIKTITVRASPIASFAPPINVCLNGGPIQLAGTEIGGVGGTSVYMGTGVSPTGLFNPLTVGAGITDTITFTAISLFNCDSALKRPIHVLIPPVANFTTTGNLCVGGPSNANVVTFHQTSTVTPGEGGAIVKWIYDWGDGTPVQTFTSGADVTHVYITAGPKIATLTVEDAFGCRNAPAKQLPFTVNPLPVPDYTFTPSACLPSATIVFTNNTPGPLSNYSFNWSFELPSIAAGNTSTAPNPSHTYTTQGPFNTHLVATNIATGCKDSTSIIPIGSSVIHPAPVLQFTAVPDVCLNNGTVQLTQGSETSGIAGGPGIYTGTGVSASGIFNPITAGVGTHIITYTWTSTFNCPTSITQNVKVLAAPVVNTFTPVGNICEQNGTVFHNTTTQGAGTITNWVYDWADGTPIQTVGNGNDVTHLYTNAGTYFASLYVITNDGCKSIAKPLTVVVNALPKTNFTFTTVACLPQAKIDFTNTTPAQSTGGLAYQWTFDDVPATIKTTINADFTYYTLGSHPVQLTATNTTTFCKKTFTQDIMNSLHPAPTASFNFSKQSVCIKDNVTVIDAPSNPADGTMTDWKWNYGDNNAIFTGQIQAPHTYTSAGTFNVKLIVTNSFGCVDDTSRPFTVHPYPVVNAGRDSVILQGGNLVLTATASGNDLTYLWTGTPAPINLSSSTVLNPLVSPVEDIYYTLKVTARGGCADTNGVFIKVLKYPIIPNTFTPNNDGVHDTWVIKYLESYPDNRVQVFTRAGQLVFESKRYMKPWDGTVNGKSLPFDTYYYIIEPGTGRIPMTGYVTIVK